MVFLALIANDAAIRRRKMVNFAQETRTFADATVRREKALDLSVCNSTALQSASDSGSAGHPKFFQWPRKIISIRTMLAIKQLR
jgi:hypothetical protein